MNKIFKVVVKYTIAIPFAVAGGLALFGLFTNLNDGLKFFIIGIISFISAAIYVFYVERKTSEHRDKADKEIEVLKSSNKKLLEDNKKKSRELLRYDEMHDIIKARYQDAYDDIGDILYAGIDPAKPIERKHLDSAYRTYLRHKKYLSSINTFDSRNNSKSS